MIALPSSKHYSGEYARRRTTVKPLQLNVKRLISWARQWMTVLAPLAYSNASVQGAVSSRQRKSVVSWSNTHLTPMRGVA